MNKNTFELLQSFAMGTPWREFVYICAVERENHSQLCWNVTGRLEGGTIVTRFFRFSE